MSAQTNTDNDAPVPCANDCGFWGRPSTNNYCSSCYKQKIGNLKDNKQEKKESPTEEKVEKEVKIDEEAKTLAVKDLSIEEKPKERKVQKNRKRCFECRKKVGLTGSECRCGYVFCGLHRYPEEHKCDFDFHKLAKTHVCKKANAAVADKIQGEKLQATL